MKSPRLNKTIKIFCGILAASSIGLAAEQDSFSLKITPHGNAALEMGQIVNGYDKNAGRDPIYNVVTEKVHLSFSLDVELSPHTLFTGGIADKTFNEFPRFRDNGGTRRYYHYFYLTQAELDHKVFENGQFNIHAGGGYFPCKYSNDSRNLGEYLFRSTAYPQTLTTEFDFPFARLMGAYAKSAWSSGIHKASLDLLATTNTEWMAIHDLNLSLLASYNCADIFEIGAGASFGSILSMDPDATSPKDLSTAYMSGTDTMYYTFKGTKVMARVSFDPKKFFPSGLFGKEDLKLYSEAAFLGTKDYPAAYNSPLWYMSPLERIPVMAGFNVPAFKIFDVISIEGEWWGNRYPNSLEGIVKFGLPLPFPKGTEEIDSTVYKNDNIKWSIFGSKVFAKHYRLAFQVANDHMRTFAWEWSRQDWEESMRAKGCWYYALKFGILF